MLPYLSLGAKTKITGNVLSHLVSGEHLGIRGRNEPGNILPGANRLFLSQNLERPSNVSIYVVTQPYEYLGIKLVDGVPDGLT